MIVTPPQKETFGQASWTIFFSDQSSEYYNICNKSRYDAVIRTICSNGLIKIQEWINGHLWQNVHIVNCRIMNYEWMESFSNILLIKTKQFSATTEGIGGMEGLPNPYAAGLSCGPLWEITSNSSHHCRPPPPLRRPITDITHGLPPPPPTSLPDPRLTSYKGRAKTETYISIWGEI